jgi:hypothetical protein
LPFDPQQAPLVRAVLIHEPDKVMLILSAHHSIADALSIVFAIRDVLHVLSEKEIDALSVPPSLDSLFETAVSPQADKRAPAKPGRYRELDSSALEVRRLSLKPDVTARLRERARQEGTTVYGALCAALILAGRRLCADWREQPVRIMSPISVRELVGVGEDCGLFTTAAIVPFEPGASDTFWEVARYCKRQVADVQTRESIAAGIQRLQSAVKYASDVQTAALIGAQAFAREMVISNLGNLGMQLDAGHLKVEAIWGPAIPTDFDGEQTIGAATLNGSLFLIHTGCPAMPGLLDEAERILNLACAVEEMA